MQYEDILDQTLYAYSWSGDKNNVDEFLDYAGEIDLSEPDYSLDLMGVWVRKSDGQVLYAFDSGCSCPAPWESTPVRDLLETTVDRIVDIAADATGDRYSPIPLPNLRQQARDVAARARDLGGK